MSSSENEIKIVIADGHEIFREGIKSLLNHHNRLQVLAETDRFNEASEYISQYKPNVMLLDNFLADGNCVERIPELLSLCPKTKILLFTHNQDESFQLYALRLGISGILQKNCSAELLIRAIEKVGEGQVWFDRNLTQLFLQTKVEDNSLLDNLISNLSSREHVIVCLASKGMSAKDMSGPLRITEKTIRNQMSIIYSKLEIKNHVGLSLEFRDVNLCGTCAYEPNNCPRNGLRKT